jgi:hypothetical protein
MYFRMALFGNFKREPKRKRQQYEPKRQQYEPKRKRKPLCLVLFAANML